MRLSRLPVFLGLVLGALALPAAADWRETFADGVRAWDLGQWREAARRMREATAEKPEATGEKIRIYGMKWERYLPYYYLGMALYEVDDCRAALAAFDTSHAEGAVGLVGRTRMKGRMEDCQNRLGVFSDAPASSPSAPSPHGGSQGGGRVSPPTVAGPPSPSPSPPNPPPPSRPSQTTEEARREALREKVAEVEESLRRAGEVTRVLDAHLERTRRAAFRREPALEERYQAAYRQLNNARFVLSAGRRENDLQAVTRAGTEAEKALAELEAVARVAGVEGR